VRGNRAPSALARRLYGPVVSAAGLTAARALTQAGVFISAVAVARSLGPGSFGKYSFVLSLAGLTAGGLGAGLPVLAIRETAAGRGGAELNGRLLLSQLVATGVGTVALGLVGYLFLGGTGGMIEGLLAGAVYIGFSMVTLGSSLQAGRQRYLRPVLGESVTGIACASFTIASLSLGLGVLGAIASLAIGTVVGISVLWWGVPLAVTAGARAIVDSLRQATPFLALGILSAGYLRIDTVVLGLVASQATVGIYSAAYRILGPFALLLSGFGTVFYSRLSMSGRSAVEWHRVRRQARALLLATLVPLVVVGFLAAPWLVERVYGPSFSSALLPTRILLISVIPLALYWPAAHALNAAGRERTWTLLLAALMAADAGLVVLLGHPLGATGAALAWLIAESLLLVLITPITHWLKAPAAASGSA
jgi:O-antigen/teichoic acid export membrane protein